MIKQRELEIYIESRGQDALDVCRKKGGEYTPADEDALANIREIAHMVNKSPREVCYILATKHWQSLIRNSQYYNNDTMIEKGNDVTLYLYYAEIFRSEEILEERERMIWD